MIYKTDTTSSPALDLAKSDWSFAEVWIDPMQFPPYVLLLLGGSSGHCHIYDPAQGYKVIFSSVTYDAAQLWLLEDEYEPIEGRLSGLVF